MASVTLLTGGHLKYKDVEAKALLDSISTAYPEHPLKDDIIMQRANIALKHECI